MAPDALLKSELLLVMSAFCAAGVPIHCGRKN